MLLERIQLFINAARHNNLGKAAREMHISASSVCQRLKSLERDFGAQLYKKNKDGIELTAAGTRLLASGSQILDHIETLRKELQSDPRPTTESVCIGGTFSPSGQHLPFAIAAFRKSCPEIKVDFFTSHKTDIQERLRDFRLDLALVQSPVPDAHLTTEHFASDHLVFFVHPSHSCAKKQKLSLEDIQKIPLIVRKETVTTKRLLDEIERRGFRPNVVLSCATPYGVQAAVRNKIGVGILFFSAIESELQKQEFKVLKLRGLEKMLWAESCIVYNKTKPLSAPATKFLHLLRSVKPGSKKSRNHSRRAGE